MPKKILVFIFVSFITLFLFVPRVHASDALTPFPTSATCDLCGYCPSDRFNPAKPPNWDQCRSCLYLPGTNSFNPNKHYTVFGCISTNSGEFVSSILKVVFSVAGGITFLSVLSGAATVLTSSGNPEKIQKGKELIMTSLLGMLLVVFAVFILRLVGYDILGIPGFG